MSAAAESFCFSSDIAQQLYASEQATVIKRKKIASGFTQNINAEKPYRFN